jgi:shikimate dehydrogenase
MDRYAVIGNPVAHSLSPEIPRAIRRADRRTLEYARLLIAFGAFAREAKRFFDEGARGANVTLPFKEDAFRFAIARSERADIAGAAELPRAVDAGIIADTHRRRGLVRDLTGNHGWSCAAPRSSSWAREAPRAA